MDPKPAKPAIVKPRTPSGTLELLPQEQAAFQHMLDVIRATYERFGFRPIETPAFELVDILLTKSGGETEKQVYFVQSTGAIEQGHKPESALHFDLTVPLARYVAEHERNLAFPFRRYQMQRCYRGERPQKYRQREFYQCDIDIVGKDHLASIHDAEMPAIIASIFDQLQIGDFTIHISNRKVMLGYLTTLGIESMEMRVAVLREIDKLDKTGMDGVRAALLREPLSLDAMLADEILTLAVFKGEKGEVIERLRGISNPSPELSLGIAELAELAAALKAMAVPDHRTNFNLSIVRGLDYYTGTVYETLLHALPGAGSICSGGRYENLAGLYTRASLPGVGISIGATRLFEMLKDLQLVAGRPPMTKVLVAHMSADLDGDALRIATLLRQAGIATEVYLEPDKLDKQLRFAEKAGIPLMVMRGADETKTGQATVRHLLRREQMLVGENDLVTEIVRLLAS